MKKLIIGVLVLLLIGCCSFIYINYDKINKYQSDIDYLKRKTESIKGKENLDSKDIVKEKEVLENLENEKKDEIEVYEKWRKEVQKIKDLL